MSKFLNYLVPTAGGIAIVLGGAFALANRDYGAATIETLETRAAQLSAQAEAARAAAAEQEARTAELAGEIEQMAARAVPTSQGESAPESVSLDLGRAATPDEVAAWDIDIRPDGHGLPEGSGDVMTGEVLYTDQCSVCHGVFGEAIGRWPQLAGGFGTLDGDDPVKTIGSYWPFLSTVYDYVHRAMPFGNAQSLGDDEVYAITAYLLFLNDLVDEDFELSHENFTEIRLPNEENFFLDDRPGVELTAFSGEPCMENCKDSVEITGRAQVVDVTPDDAAARQRREAAAAAAGPATDAGDSTETTAADPAADTGETVEEVEVAAADPAATETGAEAAQGDLDPALVEAGEKAFKKCSACHQVGDGAKNRSGPQLNGVIGRVAGSVEDFKYSSAFADANADGLVWTDETLAEFLAKPRDYISGTKMSFAGVRDEEDIAAVIAYLRTFDE